MPEAETLHVDPWQPYNGGDAVDAETLHDDPWQPYNCGDAMDVSDDVVYQPAYPEPEGEHHTSVSLSTRLLLLLAVPRLGCMRALRTYIAVKDL
jgi:hypothetical protein